MTASFRIQELVLGVNALHVGYGERQVLKGLSLNLRSGEVFGLLGPNGAGKTTLIRSVCNRVKIESGTISVAGRPVTDRRALHKIGLVPQEIALYQHLTARENLKTFARLNGVPRKQAPARIDYAIEAAKLAKQVDDPVHSLSGGWKRRVNIAAAILHRPALLILDEPTVGVDIEARNTLHKVIKTLRDTGMAVLLATHDMDQAETLCGSVGFLRGGVLSPAGDPSKLLETAFKGKDEVLLRLRELATPKVSEIFSRLGFVGDANSLERRRLFKVTPGEQARLARTLQDKRFGIREVRFRKPGLESLFLFLKEPEIER